MHLRRYWHSDRGDLSTRVLLLPEAACSILNEVRKYRPKELCRDLGSMKYAVHSQVVIAVVLPETEVMRMSYYEIRLKTERVAKFPPTAFRNSTRKDPNGPSPAPGTRPVASR